MPQGLLPFHYAEEKTGSGMTALAGLPLYLELAQVAGVMDSIRRHLRVAGSQGWDDVQVVLALLLLQLAGGSAVEDLSFARTELAFSRKDTEAATALRNQLTARALLPTPASPA